MVLRGCAHSADKSLGRLFKGGGVQGQGPCRVWAEPNAACANKKRPPSHWTERRRARSHSPVSLKGPLSLPMRRALPLPLPDARSPPLPEGRFQPAAALLCQIAMGTLSVPRGFHPHYITSSSASCQEDFIKGEEKRRRRGSGKPCAMLENFGTEQPDAEKILAGSGWYVFRNMTDESD
jgi:hypothetical protein